MSIPWRMQCFLFITGVLLLSFPAQGSEDNPAFSKTFKKDNIAFHISCPNISSLNKLTISPSGFSKDNSLISTEIDGTVTEAEIADLNGDGFPEIYVYITSAGSGSYGSLVAYSSNHNISPVAIKLPPLEDGALNAHGYMGHDMFFIKGKHLVRRFPIYKKRDSNVRPTGGLRQILYTLTTDGTSWQLRITDSSKF